MKYILLISILFSFNALAEKAEERADQDTHTERPLIVNPGDDDVPGGGSDGAGTIEKENQQPISLPARDTDGDGIPEGGSDGAGTIEGEAREKLDILNPPQLGNKKIMLDHTRYQRFLDQNENGSKGHVEKQQNANR